MSGKKWMILGAVSAAIAVALGAFGAHGLESRIEALFDDLHEQNKWLDNWKTAARYQIWHAIGLVLIGITAGRIRSSMFTIAAISMIAGTILFSGCMYAYVLSGQKWLGMILPIGGLAFINGWILFAVGVAYGNPVLSVDDQPVTDHSN